MYDAWNTQEFGVADEPRRLQSCIIPRLTMSDTGPSLPRPTHSDPSARRSPSLTQAQDLLRRNMTQPYGQRLTQRVCQVQRVQHTVFFVGEQGC